MTGQDDVARARRRSLRVRRPRPCPASTAPATSSRRGRAARCDSHRARGAGSRRCSGTPARPQLACGRREASAVPDQIPFAAAAFQSRAAPTAGPTTPFCTSCSTSARVRGRDDRGEGRAAYARASGSSRASSAAISLRTLEEHVEVAAGRDPGRLPTARASPRGARMARDAPTTGRGRRGRGRAGSGSRYVVPRPACVRPHPRYMLARERDRPGRRDRVLVDRRLAAAVVRAPGCPSDVIASRGPPAHRHTFDHVGPRRRHLQPGHVLAQDRACHHRTSRIAGAQGHDVEIRHTRNLRQRWFGPRTRDRLAECAPGR